MAQGGVLSLNRTAWLEEKSRAAPGQPPAPGDLAPGRRRGGRRAMGPAGQEAKLPEGGEPSEHLEGSERSEHLEGSERSEHPEGSERSEHLEGGESSEQLEGGGTKTGSQVSVRSSPRRSKPRIPLSATSRVA
ncbi:hypothetical protein [Streptomyces sp. NPDC048309]|uniref:hypothetical protein n=2 Tax=unclassified Streptomyces TaxID=2593676 RepID=UPI0033DB1D3F